MLRLSTYGRPAIPFRSTVVGRVRRTSVTTGTRDEVFVTDGVPTPKVCRGYTAIATTGTISPSQAARLDMPIIHRVPSVDHLSQGDVVALDPSGHIRTLYRRGSRHNTLLATERCNSFCVMCSQPPRDVDETGIVEEHLRVIELMDPATEELGISGGEPTLLKDDLLRLVERCRDLLPRTALHILSNGRLFYYGSFASRIAEIRHPNLMFGVPLYSDIDYCHDYVVQCRGAFDDTIVGLLNLGQHQVPVEIRVVVHRDTYARLPDLARFVYRNLTFASHVTFMGLEPMGFAAANLRTLWIDPWDYRDPLEKAVLFLARRGMNVSIYNNQLCTMPESLWPYGRKSISDWKNEYLPVCEQCDERERCCGFFSSSIRRVTSTHIRPICRSTSNPAVLGSETAEPFL